MSHVAAPLYSSLAADPDLGEIVDMFVDEMPTRVQGLLDQIAASDWSSLERTAHQIKGAAGSYGFDQLTAPAARLEEMVRERMREHEIRVALDELVDLCRRVRAGTPQ